MHTQHILFLLAVLLISFSCSLKKSAYQGDSGISQPVQTDDGWLVSSLDSANINPKKLKILVDRISDSTYQDIHSILIVKDGKLVFEQYFKGHSFDYEAEACKGVLMDFSRDVIHNLASVTKSVTSILVGIAHDHGFIGDLNDKLFTYFPEYASLNDSIKNRITIHDALTMTSGFQWNENSVSYKEMGNDIIRLFYVEDPVKYIMSKPTIHAPGSTFHYNGGNTILLGEIIRKTSGLRLDDFASKYLFDPLGIEQYNWTYLDSNLIYASGDLKLKPRDMAKVGYLMLNEGDWNDNRILSTEWIEQSTVDHVHFNDREGYGFQWWTKKYKLGKIFIESFAANGWGGQRIMVIPDLNAVVVFTAGNYEGGVPYDEIMYRYILPSLNKSFTYNYEIIKNEAPISDSIQIIEPSQDIRPDIAKLSGHWYGMGDYWVMGQFVVEEIDSSKASVIYAWGDHPDGYFERGWVRTSATVDSSGRIFLSLHDVNLIFKLDKEENVLIGDYTKGQVKSKLIFNRLEN